MATYVELTNEQKDVLQTFTNLVRSWAGEQARVNNHAAAINTQYLAQIQAILVDLDTNELIPNTSGLAGAQALTSDSDLVGIVSHLQGVLTNYNTSGHREMWVKACGAANLIG